MDLQYLKKSKCHSKIRRLTKIIISLAACKKSVYSIIYFSSILEYHSQTSHTHFWLGLPNFFTWIYINMQKIKLYHHVDLEIYCS